MTLSLKVLFFGGRGKKGGQYYRKKVQANPSQGLVCTDSFSDGEITTTFLAAALYQFCTFWFGNNEM